jgi:hypothetical protein
LYASDDAKGQNFFHFIIKHIIEVLKYCHTAKDLKSNESI